MKEIRIDISGHRSKEMSEFQDQTFDYVITLCDSAHETCPYFFGGVEITHIGFSDPAGAIGSEEEIMYEFRHVRDEIKDRLLSFFAEKLLTITPFTKWAKGIYEGAIGAGLTG